MLDDVYFWGDGDSELLIDILADGVAELEYLLSCGSTKIDQHKCLEGIHSRLPQILSFPSALFDHPPSRNLHSIFHLIIRHRRILLEQTLEYLTVNDRILEETTCIALNLWVGQFGLPDTNNGISDQSRSDCFSICQFPTYVAIIEMRSERFVESIGDISDSVLVLQLLFEDALSIAVATFFYVEHSWMTCLQVNRFDKNDKVLDFHTICPYILHSRSTYFSWD